MRAKGRKAKVIRLARYAAMTTLVGGTAAVIVLWLVFQHKPAWYAPVSIDPGEHRDIRARLTKLADDISHQLVEEESIELSFTDETVNRWLAAMPHVWPDARRSVPTALTDLVVAFEEGGVRVGSLYDRNGWRAILSVVVELGVSDDRQTLRLRLVEAHGGSLPIPNTILQRILDRLADDTSGFGRSSGSPQLRMDRIDPALLLEGTTIPNRFVWPNGDRAFRIEALELTNGRIRLNLRPL